jgi:hypothetical protein
MYHPSALNSTWAGGERNPKYSPDAFEKSRCTVVGRPFNAAWRLPVRPATCGDNSRSLPGPLRDTAIDTVECGVSGRTLSNGENTLPNLSKTLLEKTYL